MKIKFVLMLLIISIIGCSKNEKENAIKVREKVFNQQVELHKVYSMKNPDVVMLGNSITFGVNWIELLGRERIANRGISRDITENMLKRLDEIIFMKPKYCFIMSGINDIYDDISVDSIFVNYSKILNRLIDNNITPVIQSTLYVSSKWKKYETKNREVDQLNSLLRGLAGSKQLRFVDVNSVLSDGTNLIEEFTHDGVHLTAKGYERWGKLVNKTLNDLKLPL